MFVKGIGLCFVFLAFALGGQAVIWRGKWYEKELFQMKNAFFLFASGMEGAVRPLGEILFSAGEKAGGSVGALFLAVAEQMERRSLQSAEEIWMEEVKKMDRLEKGDLEMLCSFGKMLSQTDARQLIVSARQMEGYADRQEGYVREKNNKNNQLYRNLGLMAGALAVIVLV
ncbi:MAG: stage III sporulation protein AB [Clostridiales bacterium]|nr:stage III sporulation protein AB [Clostridiales bacterium]